MASKKRIAVPGEHTIPIRTFDIPRASPSAMYVPGTDEHLLVAGGYTKLEFASIQIAAGMAAASGYNSPMDLVEKSIEIAAQLLKECAHREGTREPAAISDDLMEKTGGPIELG